MSDGGHVSYESTRSVMITDDYIGQYAVGLPGTGKSHVATALGVQAVEHHRRKVRFFSTIELVNALEQEKARGKAGQIAETLTTVTVRSA